MNGPDPDRELRIGSREEGGGGGGGGTTISVDWGYCKRDKKKSPGCFQTTKSKSRGTRDGGSIGRTLK